MDLTKAKGKLILNALTFASEWKTSVADSCGYETAQGKRELEDAKNFRDLRDELARAWGEKRILTLSERMVTLKAESITIEEIKKRSK